jgi:hypothetical protein
MLIGHRLYLRACAFQCRYIPHTGKVAAALQLSHSSWRTAHGWPAWLGSVRRSGMHSTQLFRCFSLV